ncbi:MAG: hypothetical protein RI962_1794, partial [Pseudomonadota bacterium]
TGNCRRLLFMQIEIQASRQFDDIAYLKTISPHVGAQ